MRLHPLGGLGNRLAAILSYRQVYPDLVVEWADLSQVGGSQFLDVFEPLPGVTFVEGPAFPLVHEGGPVVVGEITGDNFALKSAHPTWVEGYRELRLLPHLQAKLPPRPYSAIHVRRTDHVPLARAMGCYTDDAAFLAFCKEVPGPIFIATDNGTTQRDFAGWIGAMDKPTFVQEWIEEHAEQNAHDKRNTDMAFAAVDLFTCARADRFMGTAGSSFSVTIELLRRLGGWWS